MEGVVILRRWPVSRRENDHVMDAARFNGGRINMLQMWPV